VRIIRFILLVIISIAAISTLLYSYYGYSTAPPRTLLTGELNEGTITIEGRERSYTAYIPTKLAKDSALVFMLHSSLQTVNGVRESTAYQFEQLAEHHKFIVVYPSGYKKNWNDCRAEAKYPARAENINDIKFITSLISEFHQRYGSDTAKTFIAGYSNGGHLGFRFAMEHPNAIAGIAAISASLPTADNLACEDTGKAVPVLIMNGTEDPINPYYGGRASLFGVGNRGQVLSSISSAQHFARKAGYHDAPSETKHFQSNRPDDPTATEYYAWRDGEHPEVILYTIVGGGHTIPQEHFRPPRILGATSKEIDGPAEIWAFFARQIRRVDTAREYPE
jgi:polyhydroxybutyrate depolymerase